MADENNSQSNESSQTSQPVTPSAPEVVQSQTTNSSPANDAPPSPNRDASQFRAIKSDGKDESSGGGTAKPAIKIAGLQPPNKDASQTVIKETDQRKDKGNIISE